VAKKTKRGLGKKNQQQLWSRAEVSELRKHSKARTPVIDLEKPFKRKSGAIRQKARLLGLPMGHRKRSKKR